MSNDDETLDWLLTLPEIEQLMATTFEDVLVMRASGLTITNQPPVTLALVPTVEQTQALARSHVRDYQDHLSQGHISIFEQVQAHYRMLQNFLVKLTPLARAWDAGDNDSAAEEFRRGLTLIGHHAGSNRAAAVGVQDDFRRYHQSIADDLVRHQTDEASAERRVGGAGGEIATLRQRLDELGASLSAANRRIAEGATRDVVKAVEQGVKVGMTLVEVPGVGEIVVDTTLDYVDEAVGDGGDPLADSDQLLADYRAILERLADEQAQLGALAALKLNVGRFEHSLVSTLDTLDRLGAAWDDVAKRLALLSAYKRAADGTDFFATQLSQAQTFWSTMCDRAAQYEAAIRLADWGTTDER